MPWSKSVAQQLQTISQQGMQQAADTFSRLLRQPVSIDVADCWRSDRLPPGALSESSGIGIYMGISGEFSGGLLLFLVEDCARWLTGKLLCNIETNNLLSEPASSTLKEVGNIICSAFLASLDDQLGLRSLPNPPVLSSGAILELVTDYQQGVSEPCLVVRTRLQSGAQEPVDLQGESYLFLSCRAMEQLVARFVSP